MNAASSLSVSIIIPTYNGLSLLQKNLPSVLAAAKNQEVIVVDDASTDTTVDWLTTTYPQIRLVPLKQNSRFAKACNSGVAKASGEIIVLLNNDVEPAPHFLDALLAAFNDPNVFAASSAEIDPVTHLVSGRSGGVFERGVIRHYREKDQSATTTLWAAGGSSAFRKSMWHQLAGLDECFWPAYDEDRDLSYRALKRGLKVVFVPQSQVFHRHETTNKKIFPAWYLEAAKHKNALLLIWKNITSITYLIQHLGWLPYHLIITGIKTKGMFPLGCFWALCTVPKLWPKRKIETAAQKVTDETLLHLA